MTAVSDRLDAIQAQLDAATPGPWDWNTHDRSGARWSLEGEGEGILTCGAMLWPDETDAVFIAAAPENTRYLLDLARKQQAQLDAVRAVHEQIPGYRIGDVACEACSTSQGYVLYPCPTIRALEAKP